MKLSSRPKLRKLDFEYLQELEKEGKARKFHDLGGYNDATFTRYLDALREALSATKDIYCSKHVVVVAHGNRIISVLDYSNLRNKEELHKILEDDYENTKEWNHWVYLVEKETLDLS